MNDTREWKGRQRFFKFSTSSLENEGFATTMTTMMMTMMIRQARTNGLRSCYRILITEDKTSLQSISIGIRRYNMLRSSFINNTIAMASQRRVRPRHSYWRNPPSVIATTTFTTTVRDETSPARTSITLENPILHYKWIYPTAPNDTETHGVEHDDEYIFVFLHGLFGQSKNLSTFAQKFIQGMVYPNDFEKDGRVTQRRYSEANEGRKCSGLLVDLYGHGLSSKLSMNTAAQHLNSTNIQDILSSTLGATIRHCLVERETKKMLQPQDAPATRATHTEPTTIVPKLILVGHSLGGRVALHFVTQALLQASKARIRQSQLQDAQKYPTSMVVPKESSATSWPGQEIDSNSTVISTSHDSSKPNDQLDDIYVPLLPHHIWLLDTVPNKPDSTVVQVLEAIESIHKQKPLMKSHLQEPKESKGINDKDTVEENESLLSRNDIRQKIMKYNHNIPLGIVEWIASQWLIKEQRFLFDINVVRSIVSNLSLEENDKDNEPSVEEPKQSSKLTFWKQLDTVLQQSTNIQIHMVQADQNQAWYESAVQEPLQARLQRYENIPHPSHSQLTHHMLNESGHWVHVDNLPGLIDIMTSVSLEP